MDNQILRKYLTLIIRQTYPCKGKEVVNRVLGFSKIRNSFEDYDIYKELSEMEYEGIIKRITIEFDTPIILSSIYSGLLIPSDVKVKGII